MVGAIYFKDAFQKWKIVFSVQLPSSDVPKVRGQVFKCFRDTQVFISAWGRHQGAHWKYFMTSKHECSGKYDFKWTNKIFYSLFVRLRICSACRTIFYFVLNKFWCSFYTYNMRYTKYQNEAYAWLLIWSVKQGANEWPCVKMNTK